MSDDARKTLERLCQERGQDFRSLSRMLGRNTSYIQQFVRQGTPKLLGEEERRKLARYFGVPETLFGGSIDAGSVPSGLFGITRNPTLTDGGPAAEVGGPASLALAIDGDLLKSLAPSALANLTIVRIDGDSMSPTFNDGDEAIVDRGDSNSRLRDGIYVLRINNSLLVRRIAMNPLRGSATIKSDNPAYSDWEDCSPTDIESVGRVIWGLKRVF